MARNRRQIQNYGIYHWKNHAYFLDILKKIDLKQISERFCEILKLFKHFKNNFLVKFKVNRCLKIHKKISISVFYIFINRVLRLKNHVENIL